MDVRRRKTRRPQPGCEAPWVRCRRGTAGDPCGMRRQVRFCRHQEVRPQHCGGDDRPHLPGRAHTDEERRRPNTLHRALPTYANASPPATIADRPSRLRPSEVTQGGKRAAIFVNRRFSADASRLRCSRTWFMAASTGDVKTAGQKAHRLQIFGCRMLAGRKMSAGGSRWLPPPNAPTPPVNARLRKAALTGNTAANTAKRKVRVRSFAASAATRHVDDHRISRDVWTHRNATSN